MTLYPKLITDALAQVRYPGTGKSLIEAGMLEDDVRISGMSVSFTLLFPKLPDPFEKSVVKAAEAAIHTFVDKDVEVTIRTKSLQAAPPEPGKMLPEVKNVIAVSSGKGGVGKSTVAANLAVALARLGYRVGLLDTDIFGPSVPKMFHLEHEQIFAIEKEGRQLIVQMDVETDWGELDYLVLDTPPGTSDIHLTLLQTLAITGAVIVSTPQEVALADARKGIDMYQNEKVGVPILGLVENMAWFTPEELPDNKYYIFGEGGVARLAEEMNVPLLAQIPIVQGIRESGDVGEPVALHPERADGQAFLQLAAAVAEQTERRNREQAPTEIVKIEKN